MRIIDESRNDDQNESEWNCSRQRTTSIGPNEQNSDSNDEETVTKKNEKVK